MRKSMLATALFAVLGAASLASPASAVPAGPAAGLAVPADLLTDVRMTPREHRMMHRRMHRRHMMRHHGMHRHMRHGRTIPRKKGL